MLSITLQIGALCEPISKQLAGHISQDAADRLDRHSDAITHCYVMGFMPQAQTDRARKKLLEMCKKAVVAHANSSPTNVPVSNSARS